MVTLEKRQGTTPQGTDYFIVVAKTSEAIRPAVHTSFEDFLANHRYSKAKQNPRWAFLLKVLGK